MSDFIVVGTDTNAGKTTFSAMFLAAFYDVYTYWKPVETGDSDSATMRKFVPVARVEPSLAHYQAAVAPALAAKRENRNLPSIDDVIHAVPKASPLLIETFGSPMSPWHYQHLQLELIRQLCRPIVLVSSSAVGAVGRTLQSISGLQTVGLMPTVVVLIGPNDDYANDQIQRHSGVRVIPLHAPEEWSVQGFENAARENLPGLQAIRDCLSNVSFNTDWIRRDRSSVWHPYTSLSDPVDPLPVVHMQDEFLTLSDGRKLIDAISSWWTIQHGHRHPPLMKALHRALNRYDHVHFAGVTHQPAVELAELLLQTTRLVGGKVFYSDNGSTAVEVALKMAYQYWQLKRQPKRTKFVCLENSYHGDTFGAMAVSRDPLFFGRFEPLMFDVIQIPVDVERLRNTLENQAAEIASVIIEPLVQGAGGMLMHTPQDLRAISELCRAYGVLLIVDEVFTGGGRTGEYWAHDHAGITPDLICAGKTIAGGMLPIAATVVSAMIVAEFESASRKDTFFHGHSFTAHPLACAVGVENLKLMQTAAWKTEVKRIEQFWRDRLSELEEYENVAEIRICGTIAAIELKSSVGYLSERVPRMKRKALECGVVLRPLGDVIYSVPPFCIRQASLEAVLKAMRACIEDDRHAE